MAQVLKQRFLCGDTHAALQVMERTRTRARQQHEEEEELFQTGHNSHFSSLAPPYKKRDREVGSEVVPVKNEGEKVLICLIFLPSLSNLL